MKENPMNKIKIEKVVLSIGATGEDLEKAVKLLGLITEKKPMKTKSRKRIPSLGVRPGLEIGAMVTIRKNPQEILKRLLESIENSLNKKQVADNHLSFGIREYIEIPGIEYQRDIGIIGLDVTIVFVKPGKKVKLKKIKKGKFSKRQYASKQEIIKYMEDNFQTEFT
ncbi:MAG: 50S ribosomal protein L5 [Nanoarchaeota archaeon]